MGRDKNERAYGQTRGSRRSVDLVVDTFFRPESVMSPAEKGRMRALIRAGAMIRGFARRSMKRPPRVSLSAMTPEQRKAHERRLRKARRIGGPTPKRPFASAPPGKPPYNRDNLVRDMIFFGLSSDGDNVSVGAVEFGKGTVGLLEHGGDAMLPGRGGERVQMHFRGNPFMQPARDAALPQVPGLFQGIVR